MTCPPFCDTCGGNLGRGGTERDCEKCLRSCRKERIRKEEFEYDNYSHFALRTRGGGFRYYRKVA